MKNKPSKAKALPSPSNRDRQSLFVLFSSLSYGEFQNVFLTASQFDDLQSLHPGICLAYIERLSQYMESTGKTYHSHYATIKSWIAQDAKKTPSNKYDYDHTYEEGECL